MNDSKAPTDTRPTRARWLLALAFAAPAIPAALLAPRAFDTARHAMEAIRAGHIQIDNEEGALLWQAMELGRGRLPYRPLSAAPFVVGTYPPLYLALWAPFIDRKLPDLAAGRALAAGSAAAIAALLAALAGGRTRNAAAGALAPMLFLGTFEAYNWCAYARVDLTALALTLGGLGAATVALDGRQSDDTAAHRRGDRWLTAAAALFALSLVTKQTMLPAPAAVAVVLAARRGWRVAGVWVATAGAMVAIPYTALAAATGGQAYTHMVTYNANTYHPADLLLWARHLGRVHGWALAAGGMAAGACLASWFRRNKAAMDFESADTTAKAVTASDAVVWTYAGLAWVASLSVAKAGTAENYLLEPLMATAVATSTAMGRMTAAGAPRMSGAAAVAVAALLACHASRQSAMAPLLFSRGITPARRAAAAELQRLVKAEPAGATWTEFALPNLRAGRDPVFQGFIMSELIRQGRWNPAPMVDAIAARKFQLVALAKPLAEGPNDTVAPAIHAALATAYQPAGIVAGDNAPVAYLYRPRP